MKYHTFLCLGLTMMISLVACHRTTPVGSAYTTLSPQTRIGSTPTLVQQPVSKPSPTTTITATNQPTPTEAMEISPSRTPWPEISWPTPVPIPGLEADTPITLTTLHMFEETIGWGVDAPLTQNLAGGSLLEHTTNGGLNWVNVKTVAWESAQFDFITE